MQSEDLTLAINFSTINIIWMFIFEAIRNNILFFNKLIAYQRHMSVCILIMSLWKHFGFFYCNKVNLVHKSLLW